MNDLRRKFLKGNLISAWIVLSLVAAAYLLRRFGQDLGLLNKKMTFPWEWSRPIEDAIDGSISWITRNGAFVFDPTSDLILDFLLKLEAILLWIPWPVVIIAIGWISWKSAGRGVMIFSATALLTLGIFDLWDSTMETIALITVAVLLSIVIAIPTGIVASRSDKLDVVLRAVLDGMQTMPSFVYLVPGIMLFGLGNVAAILATVLYAIPPCIRLTNLGIRQVDESVVEAGKSFGSDNLQLLLKIQIPMAIPTIMAGINQTVMMALAMSTIAAMVGAGGLGTEVLRAMGQLREGEAVVAGFAIVILAIMIDRISQGYIDKKTL